MLSHRRLAGWYVQLAQQLEAGLPLAQALRAAHGRAPRAAIDTMAAAIERGGSTDDALRAAERWLPLADQLALSASAEVGRMPQTLRALAARHSQVATAKVRIVMACLYPLVLLNLALLLLPLVHMIDWEKGFQWSTAKYLHEVLAALVPLWVVIGVLVVLARRQSSVLTLLARGLPAFRGYVVNQSLADLSFALANFLDAGVPIGRAWAAAGLITRLPSLKSAAEAMSAAVDHGTPPGMELATWPCFPPEFVALYRTGETTGQLEANLLRLTTQYQEAANRALTFATFLYPALAFAIIAAGVVYFVVTIYAGYLKMITKMAE